GSYSVNEKPWHHIPRNTTEQEKLRLGRLKRRCLLAAAGYRRNQQNAIAFLEGTGFAAEEANVFFVEIDVEELADLALIVTNVTREVGETGSEFVEGVGDGGRATVHFRSAVGEATERCRDFDGHWHF